MTWLETLFEKLRELWPFVRVRSYERGVRQRYRPWTRLGWLARLPWFAGDAVVVQLLTPGVHFQRWFLDEVVTTSVVEQTLPMTFQSVTTKDGRQLSFTVNLIYEITDAVAAETRVHAFELSVEARTRIHMARVIRGREYALLVRRQRHIEQWLAAKLTKAMGNWGARIVEVGMTEFVEAVPIRLLADGAHLHGG